MNDNELLKDIEAITAEHFLTEDDLVEFLNSDDEEGRVDMLHESDAPEPDAPAPDDGDEGGEESS